MRSNLLYHDTMASAIEAAREIASNMKIQLLGFEDYFWQGVTYGQTQRNHFEIFSKAGKVTSEYFHVVFCRMDDGRYELNTYVL